MRGLILGSSPKNKTIEEFLQQHGHSTLLVEDVFSLRGFGGQAGDFTARLCGGEERADFVVVTEAACAPPPVFGGRAATSLYLGDKPALCRTLPADGAAVFLLDAVCESPLAATVRALQDAGQLADGKRPVHCLFRRLASTGQGTEALQRRAVQQGVRLTCYENLRVQPNGQDGFWLEAVGEEETISLSAALLFADGGREESPAFRHCIETLRLWADSQGRMPTSRFFLTPVRSSRRGVFLIGQDFDARRLAEGLRSVVADLKTLPNPPDKSQNTAQVRGERCALCYTCYRICPHAALQPNKNCRQMDCLPAACEGCGNCAAVCPGDAIHLMEPPPPPEKSRGKTLLALCCKNSAALALPKALALLKQWPGGAELATRVEGQTLPCGGSVGQETLLEALLHYDQVLVASCMESACRHFEGPHHAHGQCQRLQGLLQGLGQPPNRLRWVQSSHALPGGLAEELLDFMQTREEAPE